MSALIKNMDIPSSCTRCRLLVHDEFENYYSCPASNRSFEFDEDIKNYEECKPEWCPLEEGVPIVHGRWVEPSLEKIKKMGLCGSGLCRCSVCRHEEPVFEEYPKYNYCPNCGAKMDENESEV